MASNETPEFSVGQIVWHQPGNARTRLSRVLKINTKSRNYSGFTSWTHLYTLQPLLTFPHDPSFLEKKSNNVPEYNIDEVGDVTDLCHVHAKWPNHGA